MQDLSKRCEILQKDTIWTSQDASSTVVGVAFGEQPLDDKLPYGILGPSVGQDATRVQGDQPRLKREGQGFCIICRSFLEVEEFSALLEWERVLSRRDMSKACRVLQSQKPWTFPEVPEIFVAHFVFRLRAQEVCTAYQQLVSNTCFLTD